MQCLASRSFSFFNTGLLKSYRCLAATLSVLMGAFACIGQAFADQRQGEAGLARWAQEVNSCISHADYTRNVEVVTEKSAIRQAVMMTNKYGDVVCEAFRVTRLTEALTVIERRLGNAPSVEVSQAAVKELMVRSFGEEVELCESVSLEETARHGIYTQLFRFRLAPWRLGRDVAFVVTTRWLLP